jgi:hypothetical protein
MIAVITMSIEYVAVYTTPLRHCGVAVRRAEARAASIITIVSPQGINDSVASAIVA